MLFGPGVYKFTFILFVVSDSDSHKSTPISSSFLSPPNKVVPERYTHKNKLFIGILFVTVIILLA